MFDTLKPFVPGILWWLFSLVLFTMPGAALPTVSWFDTLHVDKWVHAFLFFTMVFLFYRPFKNNRVTLQLYRWSFTIPVLGVLYGVVIEILQHTVIPYRSFDVWDIVANTVGCALAWYTWGRK